MLSYCPFCPSLNQSQNQYSHSHRQTDRQTHTHTHKHTHRHTYTHTQSGAMAHLRLRHSDWLPRHTNAHTHSYTNTHIAPQPPDSHCHAESTTQNETQILDHILRPFFWGLCQKKRVYHPLWQHGAAVLPTARPRSYALLWVTTARACHLS